MILDTIILENFGAYGGRQEAHLTPEEGKPIILFGGMNGGGKTTLLDAVQLVFYGPKARISPTGASLPIKSTFGNQSTVAEIQTKGPASQYASVG